MAAALTGVAPIHRLPNELLSRIFQINFEPDAAFIDTVAGLWLYCQGWWSTPDRLIFNGVYRTRQVCTAWYNVATCFSLMWIVLPLWQMSDAQVKLVLQHTHPSTKIVVLVNDPRSLGLFMEVVRLAAQRIRTLYMSMPYDAWPFVIPTIDNGTFPSLETAFFQVSDDGWSSWGGGTWGVGGGWGNIGPGNIGAIGANGWESAGPTPATPFLLQNLPLTTLVICDSTVDFHSFRPPLHLITLHLHQARSLTLPFRISLEDLDAVLHGCPVLEELQLWNVFPTSHVVDRYLSSASLRHVAVLGSSGAVHKIAAYLGQCNLALFVVEVKMEDALTSSTLSSNLHRAIEEFSDVASITSAGLTISYDDSGLAIGNVEIILVNSAGSIMCLRLPIEMAVVLPAIMSYVAVGHAQIAVSVLGGDDVDGRIEAVLRLPFQWATYDTIHWNGHWHYASGILSALTTSQHVSRSVRFVVHGAHRMSGFVWLSRWMRSVELSSNELCCAAVARDRSGWVTARGGDVFSPAVGYMPSHLLRMMSCDR